MAASVNVLECGVKVLLTLCCENDYYGQLCEGGYFEIKQEGILTRVCVVRVIVSWKRWRMVKWSSVNVKEMW